MPPRASGKEPNLPAAGSATGTSSAKTAIRAGSQIDRAKIQVRRRVGQDATEGLETCPMPPSPMRAVT